MKIKFIKIHILFLVFFSLLLTVVKAQTLSNYLSEAKKNYITTSTDKSYLTNNNNTTHLKFGYFINPQYTISGAQRAYVNLQQDIPWVGKSKSYRKLDKSTFKQNKLQNEYEVEQLSFQIKKCYYRMYQFQKQKKIYAKWAEELRSFNAFHKKRDSISIDFALKQFEYQAQLIEVTKKLQIVDGNYQNQVIIFNELLNSDNLDEPKLPVLLAMPEEESDFEFPDPFESTSYLSYENLLLQQQLINSTQNPWKPTVSLGLRYISMAPTDNITFGLPTKDIFEPQLQLRWNLFAKKKPKPTTVITDQLLDRKLLTLGRQLQTAINNQISARIAYDASTQKINELTKLENQLKSTQTEITKEKTLQINSLKYTFGLSQIKAVSDYYISTSKMLLFF